MESTASILITAQPLPLCFPPPTHTHKWQPCSVHTKKNRHVENDQSLLPLTCNPRLQRLKSTTLRNGHQFQYVIRTLIYTSSVHQHTPNHNSGCKKLSKTMSFEKKWKQRPTERHTDKIKQPCEENEEEFGSNHAWLIPTDSKTPRDDKESSTKCAQIKVRLLAPKTTTTTTTITQDPSSSVQFLSYDGLALWLCVWVVIKLELPWMLESPCEEKWPWQVHEVGSTYMHQHKKLHSISLPGQKSKRHEFGPTCCENYLHWRMDGYPPCMHFRVS